MAAPGRALQAYKGVSSNMIFAFAAGFGHGFTRGRAGNLRQSL